MKICIYGAGAIGGFMGHALAQVPDVELSLIARGPHLKAMQENGLTLIRDGETVSVPVTATSNPAELGPQDYVIIALKSHQAWQSAESVKPLLGPNTALVTCQNGVPWWYFHKLAGAFEGSRLDAVDRDDRQWRTFRTGPGHRMCGVPGYGNRRARRDQACLWGQVLDRRARRHGVTALCGFVESAGGRWSSRSRAGRYPLRNLAQIMG